jgi:hypothetical protein
MNNDSKVQQQQSNQVLPCQILVNKPEQFICTTDMNIPNETIKIDPTVFNNTLDKLTLLIVALTRFGKLALPLFSRKPEKKLKSKSQKKGDKKS